MKPFDVMRIQKLREDLFPLERLLGAPQRIAMPMSAHAVALTSDYATWRAEKISASYRKELDKKSRQLHRKGTIAFASVSEPARDPDDIRADEGVSRAALRRAAICCRIRPISISISTWRCRPRSPGSTA